MANPGVIQYDVQRNWTVTNDNVVGATADTGFRANSALPHPAARSTGVPDLDTINQDNDANTIYLDPANGNDGNTGTDLSSDAVLTKGRAEDLVDATRFTIHIERTDGLKTTTFTDVDAWTPTTPYFGSVFTVQVASGQTATMVMDGVVTFTIAHASNSKSIHGFIITSSIAISVCGAASGLGGFSKADFCTITAPGLSANTGVSAGAYLIQNCKMFMTNASGGFYGGIGGLGGASDSLFINNSIVAILNYKNPAVRTLLFSLSPSVLVPTVIGAGILASCTHNTFYNIGEYVHIFPKSGTPINDQLLITGDHKNNIISKCDILIVDDTDPGNVSTDTYDMDWFLGQFGSRGLAVLGDNVIEELSPLFRDVINLDFTPAHVSDTFNDVQFPINSPAIDAADDGTDLGAIQRTFTETAETSKDHELIDCGYQITMNPTRVNYQQFDNIQGASFDTWDDVQNEIILSLKKEFYVGHEQSRGLDIILRSKLAKRFYPNGTSGMFDSAITLSGVNDVVTSEIIAAIPVASLPDGEALPRWFNGWVLTLVDGGNTGFYRILSIVESGAFQLVTAEFLRGDTVNATTFVTFDFNILYIPVIMAMKKIDLKSDFYNSDIKTWLKDATVNKVAEFHTNKIVMKQSQEFLNE